MSFVFGMIFALSQPIFPISILVWWSFYHNSVCRLHSKSHWLKPYHFQWFVPNFPHRQFPAMKKEQNRCEFCWKFGQTNSFHAFFTLSAVLKFSIRFIHCWVCLAKFVALVCNCLASASNRFWFKYAWATLQQRREENGKWKKLLK